jgi:hypothetical protein
MLLDLAISRSRGSVLLGCGTKGLVRGCPEAAEQEPHLGAPLASLLKAALQERPPTPEKDEGAQERSDPPRARALGHGEAEPHLDHFAVQDYRHGQHQRHLESAPVQRGVVAVPTVVGVTPDRLPAAVALVRGRYAAALPVVLTRVCCATSQEPPLLDFAAPPGRYSPGR